MFPYKEILLLLLSTFSAFLLWRLQYQKEKIKTIESQLSDRKYRMYSELFYILFDVSNGEKIGKKLSDKDLLKRILDIKRDMFLYASDDIFKTFTQWTLDLNKNENKIDHFKIYFKLLKMIRKDMGQLNTKINLDDFMLFYMQSETEYEKFKIQNNW